MAKIIRFDAPDEPYERPRPKKSAKKARRLEPRHSVDEEAVLEELGIRPFKREFKRLRKLTTAGEDFSSSSAAYALTRSLLAMVIQAMPVAEAGVHRFKNERAMYGMNALVGTARELANDLRSFGDQGELAERVRQVVIQGALRSLATSLVQEIITARRDVHGRLDANLAKKVDARLKILQESVAHTFVKAEADVADQVARLLNAK